MNWQYLRNLLCAMLCLAAPPLLAAPGDILFQDYFERSNPGVVGNGWTVSPVNTNSACNGATVTIGGTNYSNIGCAGIDSDVPPWNLTPARPRANATRSMFLRWSNVTVTSAVINLAGKPAAQVTFWLRRGSDCFSEMPGDPSSDPGCGGALAPFTPIYGEEFQAQYLNNAGTWVVLAQFANDGTAGEIVRPVIDLPADALHASFQLRFVQRGGSGDSGSSGAPNVLGRDYWHVDDVVVTEQALTSYAGVFCDTFEGDLSRWTMTGVGNASIGSRYFQNGAHGMDLRWGQVTAMTKATNITGVTGNITFWLKRGTGNVTQAPNTTGSDKPDSGEDVVVEYLTTAGTWAALVATNSFLGSGTDGQVYCPAVGTNCATATPATNSIAIPANANLASFQLRFRLTAGTGYDRDYWHVDNVCVGTGLQQSDLSVAIAPTGNTILAPGATSTITLTVTNNGPSVEPGAITITETLPAGLNFISTSSPGWTCSTTAVVTCTRSGSLAVGASTTLTLDVQADPSASGSNLSNSATVGGQTLDTNLANNTASNSYSFVAPVFEAYEPGTTAGAISGRIYTKRAGVPFTLSVIAINNGAISTGYKRTATVDLINGAAACVTGTAALSGVTVTPASYTYRPGAGPGRDAGLHAFSFTVANAYRSVKVRIRDNNGAIGCSSDVFAVRPSSLGVTSATANADGTGASATATPAIAAGSGFSLTVTAVDAASATLTGYTGTPLIDATLLQPHAGAVATGTLSGSLNAAVAGVASGAAFSYSEVGYLRFATGGVYDDSFTAVDQPGDCTNDFSNALDASGKYGCKFGNAAATAYFGRFIPDHFDSAVTQGCTAGSYTYSGQPFTLSVTARTQTGGVTLNYHGAAAPVFAKAIALSDATAAGVGTLAPATAAATTFSNGVASLAPSYTFTNRQTAPTAITLRSVESAGGDGVSSATGSEGTTSIRSGRVNLLNAYGSERLDLPMTLRAEYWDGLGWVRNTADTCTGNTALGAANAVGVALSSPSPAGLTTCVLDSSSPGLSGAGCVAAGAAARQFRSGTTLQQGDFNLWLNRTGIAGFVTVTANVPAWLEFNWTGIGNADPVGRATFGVFKSPLIYRRENY